MTTRFGGRYPRERGRRIYPEQFDLQNPDRWGRASWFCVVIAFAMLIAAIVVFTFYWITIAQDDRASLKRIRDLREEYDALEAFVGNFSADCNCTGVNATFPVEFADDEFTIFNAADPTKLMRIDVSSNVSAGALQLLTIQDASGTVAYLSDIGTFPTVFLDDVFTVINAAVNTKGVKLNCSVITTGTIRTLTVQDASGTIAYLSDIPAVTSIFEDDVFAVQNVVDPTKEVQLDVSVVSAATTQLMTVQDASGTIAYLSDVGSSNSTYSDALFGVYADGDTTALATLDVSVVTPGATSVMTVQDKDGTIAYVDQVTSFVDVIINSSRTFPDLANEGAANFSVLGATQVQLWGCGGGGGGGGGSAGDGGGGGGSSSAFETFFVDNVATLFADFNITIGSGGAGASGAADGGDGGATILVGTSAQASPNDGYLELFGYGGAGGLNTGGSGGGGGGSGGPSVNGTGGAAGLLGGLAGGDGGAPGNPGGFRYPWHAGGGGGNGSTGAGGAAGGDWYGGGAGGAGNAFSGGGGGGAGGLFGTGGDGGASADASGTDGGFCAGGGGAASAGGTGGDGGQGLVYIRYWLI